MNKILKKLTPVALATKIRPYFFECLLANHDFTKVEIFCYSNAVSPDDVSIRLAKLASHWHVISNLSDHDAAELIRADGIDILIDLSGHTASNRLTVFARKPAPIQATWLGYPNTTGLPAIDYRITDAFADPPGTTEHLHSETLVRLPHSAWCYYPSEKVDRRSTTPESQAGYITFGSFNAQPKINSSLIELWARILTATPNSKLLLKNQATGEKSMQKTIVSQFEQSGIEQDRLVILGNIPKTSDHLAAYGRVDIALDAFPYHGTTTSCEALWMGVPVVTLAGECHVSRVGVSLLSQIGHPEWIARNSDEYVEITLRLAHDRQSRSDLRSSLREIMEKSPLMNAKSFARDIESAYRDMWRTWCEKETTVT